MNYLRLIRNENYKQYKDKINQENKLGLGLVIVATFIFLTMNLMLRMAVGENYVHTLTLNVQLVYFLVVIILYFVFLRNKNVNFTLWMYFFEGPVLMIAMMDAIVYEPNQITFLFMIFLLIFPLFIMDKPWRIAIFIICTSVIYAIASAYIEPSEVYVFDMIHLVDIALLSMGASFFFNIVRMNSIENSYHLEQIAEEDPLTGLYNRTGARKYADPHVPCVFIYMDLDLFKEINDAYGHEQGDHILIETAGALHMNFRKSDVLIRLVGDEFAVYSPGEWTMEGIENKLSDLLHSIRQIQTSGKVTASIGCVYAPNGCESLQELSRRADEAMYEAKKEGKDSYRIVKIG